MAQSDFWDRLKKRLVEVSTAAADFTEEQAIIGKIKFDILTLKRKIDRSLLEIGARVREISHEKSPGNPLNDRQVKDELDLIGDLEVQIERKKREINEVADEFRKRKDAREREKNASESRRQSRYESKPEPTPAKKTPKPRVKKEAAKPPLDAASDDPAKKKRGRPKKTETSGEV